MRQCTYLQLVEFYVDLMQTMYLSAPYKNYAQETKGLQKKMAVAVLTPSSDLTIKAHYPSLAIGDNVYTRPLCSMWIACSVNLWLVNVMDLLFL